MVKKKTKPKAPARYWGFKQEKVQRVPKAKEVITVTALLIVDNESILAALRKEYKRILKQTEKAEKDYQTFQQQDLTAWKEWIHSQFGPLLTEIRDCFDQSQRLNAIFSELDELSFLHEVPPEQAYQIYKAQKEGTWDEVSKYFKIKVPYEEAGEESGEEWPDPDMPMPDEEMTEEDLMREFTKQLASMYEKETGKKPPGFEKVMASFGQKKPQAPPDRSIKSVYRTIVLRLHPDRNKEFTPYQQSLWNEAQMAYKNQDLTALELILARIDSNNDDLAVIERGSLLHGLIEKVRRDLKRLQTHLNDAKKSPAWRFTQTKNLQPHHARAKRELEHELRNVQRNYLQIQRDFYELEKESDLWWQKITRPRPVAPPIKKKSKKAQQVDSWTGELPF